MAPAKKPAKKATRKTTKKAARKSPRKATKKAAKKSPRKATKKAAKKSARKATGKRTTAPAAPLITKSRVKGAAGGKRVASEFYDALDERVREMIARASERAESNGRSTLRPGDL